MKILPNLRERHSYIWFLSYVSVTMGKNMLVLYIHSRHRKYKPITYFSPEHDIHSLYKSLRRMSTTFHYRELYMLYSLQLIFLSFPFTSFTRKSAAYVNHDSLSWSLHVIYFSLFLSFPFIYQVIFCWCLLTSISYLEITFTSTRCTKKNIWHRHI